MRHQWRYSKSFLSKSPGFGLIAIGRWLRIAFAPILEPSGRVSLRNQTLREIILVAHGVNDNELVGGPDWIRSTDFDVDARGPADMSADTDAA
jgi:hypothetical protein